MNTRAFLKQLHKERDRLTRAIEIIESLNPIDHKGRLRGRKRRTMSLAARKRIGAAKRRWWAAHRKS